MTTNIEGTLVDLLLERKINIPLKPGEYKLSDKTVIIYGSEEKISNMVLETTNKEKSVMTEYFSCDEKGKINEYHFLIASKEELK